MRISGPWAMEQRKLALDKGHNVCYVVSMTNTTTIPKVKECITEIERAGYKYIHYSLNKYVFHLVGDGERNSFQFREVAFSLSEMRWAYTWGW
jgi:hypothetical protein